MLTFEGSSQIIDVHVTDDALVVAFADGRTLSVPLVWYPSLLNATPEQRSDSELIGDGEGVHWPQIDEDLSAEGLLRGIPSSTVRPRSTSAKETWNALAEVLGKEFLKAFNRRQSKTQGGTSEPQEFPALLEEVLGEHSHRTVLRKREKEDQPNATEAARREAEELGVDLSQVEGSGSGGRITVRDVHHAADRV